MIDPEFQTQFFMGKDWPQFQVREARRNRDGAPVIYCVHVNGIDTWVITVERWLNDRRAGRIVKCAK